MDAGTTNLGSPVKRPRRITVVPATDRGRWAVVLAVVSVALVLAGTFVPRGAALGVVSGVVGGVAALVAIGRDGERALSVFAALVPVAIAVAFAVAELTGGTP